LLRIKSPHLWRSEPFTLLYQGELESSHQPETGDAGVVILLRAARSWPGDSGAWAYRRVT